MLDRQSQRYFAKQAYQLCLMTGKTTSRYQGGKVECEVDFDEHVVWVHHGLDTDYVEIAKAWANL